jgi:putative hydrolase of HD superfamily
VGTLGVKVGQALSRITRLPRTGWLLNGVLNPESVGDHSFVTAVIALTFELQGEIDDVRAAERECCAAVLHDIGELWTGDLSPFSVRLPEFAEVLNGQWPQSLMTQEERELFAGLEPPPMGSLTDLADRLERFFQAHEYARAGVSGLASLLELELVGLRIDKHGDESIRLAKALAEYVTALANPRQLFVAPQAAMSEWYAGQDCLEALLAFQRRHGNTRLELIDEAIARGAIPIREGMRITDVGCGTADLGLYIAQRVGRASLVRIDLNREVLNSIREDQLNGISIRNYQADFSRRWPVSDGTQDIVVLGEVLEHSFDPQALIVEARRVLKPRGRMLITVPNAWHWIKIGRFLLRQRLEKNAFGEHIRYFSLRSLLDLIRSEAFGLAMRRGFSLRWPRYGLVRGRLHRVYSRLPLCAWNYFLIATRDELPSSKETASDYEIGRAIGEFLRKVSRGKKLPFSPGAGESIFQMAFRQTCIGMILARTLRLDRERVATCGVLRGCIEAAVGEYAPTLRHTITCTYGKTVLTGFTDELPPETRRRFLTLYESVASTREWILMDALFSLEYSGAQRADVVSNLPKEWSEAIEALY